METRIFLERYRLSLGRNGLPIEMHRAPAARTYRGHEIDTGREVALTIVSPAPSDPRLLEKLETEAIASEEVNHINIPRLYDFGRENDELIFVSEYWEGHTASAWVEARGPLTVAAVLRVALQVTDAMNATVFRRLYHPALNPDNILFVAGQTGEGDWPPIKILHWHGPPPPLTQPVEARAESAARFAAPEQLREGKVDVRSEIYSLGATMWFLLTGLSPAADDPGGLRTATSKLRGVPKIVRHLLERMVRPDPRERPQDPVALASYLQTCLARVERRAKMERRFGIPLTTLPRVAVPRIRRPIPLKPVALAAALLFLAALAVWSFPRQSANRRPLQSSARANRDAITSPDEINVPNEPQTVEKDSRERTDESGTSAPSAAVVAAPQPLHDELISIPPADAPAATAGTASQTDTFPTDQLTTSESGQVAAEPPPPAQGPAAKDDMEVADQKIVSREESSPNELTSAATLAPAPTAETNEPPAAAVASAPAQLADSSATAEAKADVTPIPRKTSLAKDATKARTKSLRDSSQTHLAKHRARPTHTVKRAQPVPQLRVGSAPAEFMGTTPKGNWILYVDDIGETIIVPPPPGYGP